MYEDTFARVARSLAEQFPPDWMIPPGLQAIALPDRDIAIYCRMHNAAALHACRTVVSERLEAIENGWYYEWRGLGSDPMRAALDRAECYHRLWWIDVFRRVHTC
jgi:hypothetical protein